MITNLEQTVLEKFRQLSVEKQEDVLHFLDLIQQDLLKKPTDAEVEKARKILSRAKQRAMSNSPKSVQELWTDFNRVKNALAEEYENKGS